jgi:hypothetical protein
MGLSAEQIEQVQAHGAQTDFEIWQDNKKSLQLFLLCCNQWRMHAFQQVYHNPSVLRASIMFLAQPLFNYWGRNSNLSTGATYSLWKLPREQRLTNAGFK